MNTMEAIDCRKNYAATLSLFFVMLLFVSIITYINYKCNNDTFTARYTFDFTLIEQSVVMVLDEPLIEFDSIKNFFYNSDTVTSTEFKNFVSSAPYQMNCKVLYTWLPKVINGEKAQFENRLRHSDQNNFMIWEYSAIGIKRAVSKRALYFPVLYTGADFDEQNMVGYDIAAQPEYRTQLYEAIASREVYNAGTLTDPGICTLFLPVYKIDMQNGKVTDWLSSCVGVISGTFDFEKTFEKQTEEFNEKQLYVRLLTTDSAPVILYNFLSDEHFSEDDLVRKYTVQRTIYYAGRWLQIEIIPTKMYQATYLKKDFLFIGIAGFLITAVISVLFLLLLVTHAKNRTLAAENSRIMDENETKNKMIFDTISLGIVYYDKDCKIVSLNPAAQSMFGVPAFSLIGSDFVNGTMRCIHENGTLFTADEHPAKIAFEQGNVVDNCIMGIENSGDGMVNWFLLTAVPLFNEDSGKPDQTYLIMKDITETKQIIDELSDTRKIFETCFEQIPLPMILITPDDTKIKFANSAYIRFLEIGDEPTITGKLFKTLKKTWQVTTMEGDELELATLPVIRALRGEATNGQELRVVTKHGNEKYYISYAFPIYDDNQNIIAGFAAWEEVTPMRTTIAELKKTKGFLDNIINSIPSAIAGVNEFGEITTMNRKAEILSGRSLDDAEGCSITEVFPAYGSYLEDLKTQIEAKKIIEINKIIQQIDGVNHIMNIVMYPLTDDVNGAVVVIDDVTEKARLEEMMVQTEKMMSVGGLAAGMAHEINNPLGVILQGVQNTLRRFSPEVQGNIDAALECGLDITHLQRYLELRNITMYLNGIKNAGQRAAEIVTNMLNFSRKSETRKTLCNLSMIIERSLELASNDFDLKKKFDFKNIRIIKQYMPDLPPVSVVETEIEQVMLNLLKNAAYAVNEKKGNKGFTPEILISTAMGDNTVMIMVQDNGCGIPAHLEKRIFEPFFTTKMPGIGTGLGLSVSYFIICDKHEGHISVESAEGEWTRFVISLPYANGL